MGWGKDRRAAEHKDNMKFRKLIGMIVRHWFWRIDREYEKKKRFRLCKGCKCDWHEWWHPTPWPPSVQPKEANDAKTK